MKFYVDFDDCLCETARSFTVIAKNLFNRDVPYEKMRFFNLQKSFDLNDEEYEKLMLEGHRPEVLLSYDETPGASETINGWLNEGHEVFVITGRPYSAYDASRQWLDEHNLERVTLYSLDKYGRDSFIKNSRFNLTLDDYYKMKFDYAVEDSPMAFKFFDHLPGVQVMVFDRPWNRDAEFPGDNFRRCTDWEYIRDQLRGIFRRYRSGRADLR